MKLTGTALLAACLGIAACARGPAACDRRNPLPDQQDDHWALACRIPGYGGAFLEPGEGAPDARYIVYLTDLDRAEQARSILARELREYPASIRRAPLVLRRGRYDFHQLQRWNARVDPRRLPRTVYTGIALEHNRLVVGVLDLGAKPQVLDALEKLGIPPSAVVFEHTEPISAEPEPLPLDWPEF
jgi:hypothetical protein